jgi:hypothetical protein
VLRILVALFVVLALAAPSASAKDKGNPGKGKGKGPPAARGQGGADDRHEWDGDRDEWRRFSDDDRRWWRDYWRDEYSRGHCPPGLAKKHNGCLPPGQAKKRYAIGRPLPPGVVLVAVPQPMLYRLPPLEPGYRYGMVDGDLVKLAVGTSLVVDAIDGLMR